MEANSDNRLLDAAMSAGAHEVATLIEAGCDIEAKNDKGETAAIVSAAWGFAECLQRLIDAGCDLRAQDRGGRTVLMWSVMMGQEGCVRI